MRPSGNEIVQFIDFRKELVRSAFEIGPAATRQWGDNEANRSLRSRLNADLEEFERASNERAASLGDRGRYAAWYLFLLGLAAVSLAGVKVLVMRESIVGPLTNIAKATDLIADGKIDGEVPYATHGDEIGRLARAVQHFRDTMRRNAEMQQLELGTPSSATPPGRSATNSTTNIWRRSDSCWPPSTTCRRASSCSTPGQWWLRSTIGTASSTACRRRSSRDPRSKRSSSTAPRAGCSRVGRKTCRGNPPADRQAQAVLR